MLYLKKKRKKEGSKEREKEKELVGVSHDYSETLIPTIPEFDSNSSMRKVIYLAFLMFSLDIPYLA